MRLDIEWYKEVKAKAVIGSLLKTEDRQDKN